MTKKAYMKPAMNVVKIRQQRVICASYDTNGMNKSLQNEEVSSAWSREHKNVWDDDWSE